MLSFLMLLCVCLASVAHSLVRTCFALLPSQVPVFLIGTKSDLEEDRAVSVAERTSKAKSWAAPSFECSVRNATITPPQLSTLPGVIIPQY